MDIRWDDYVGRELDGFPLLGLLGTREPRAFFLTKRNDDEALLQAAPFDAGQLERWARAARLSHPHLIDIFTAGETYPVEEEPRVIYAVSAIPDDDLGEQLSRGDFDRSSAAVMLTAIASALDYIHGQGFAHGALTPSNIFSVSGTVKLAADTIVPASDRERREDIRQLAATMAEAVGDDAGERLRGILAAAQSDDSKWTAGRVLQALAEPLTPPPVRREPSPVPAVVPPPARPAEPEAAAKPARAWMAITAVALVVVALAVFIAARGRRAAQVEAQAAAAQAERPTVIAPPPALSPAPAVEDTRTRTAPAQPGWAVIAATYGAHAGAEKRAEAIRRRWPEFKPAVHPPAGEGRHYYVILGSGLTRDEAAALQRRARQAGMPADTYVTKLRSGHLPAGQ